MIKYKRIYLLITCLLILGIGIYAAYLLLRKPTITIYKVYHTAYPVEKNDIVVPIHVGRAMRRKGAEPLLSQMIGDDTGDNISFKNDRYAELTALYWMWKNSKADYVGLMHYRRNFCMEEEDIGAQCAGVDVESTCSLYSDCGVVYDNVLKLMQEYDIITVVTLTLKDTLREHYRIAHHIEDLELAEAYIKEHYPEMAEVFDEVIDGYEFNARNMFIMPRELMSRYAEWLFDVLFHIEPQISHDDGYQRLAQAYLGERLFSVWVRYQVKVNHLKTKGLYVYVLEKAE